MLGSGPPGSVNVATAWLLKGAPETAEKLTAVATTAGSDTLTCDVAEPDAVKLSVTVTLAL